MKIIMEINSSQVSVTVEHQNGQCFGRAVAVPINEPCEKLQEVMDLLYHQARHHVSEHMGLYPPEVLEALRCEKL